VLSRGLEILYKKLDDVKKGVTPARGQVWRDPDGKKHVLMAAVVRTWAGEPPEGWTYVCEHAHGETDEEGNPTPDYSYVCFGNQWCRCLL
jgi:hypothetical protein